jgi:general L-amino acid transport system substrate-binding protein
MRTKRLVTLGLSLLLSLAATTVSASVLDDVRKRGTLICGVDAGYAGFALPNKAGEWEGFNIDLCKAMAAAVKVNWQAKALTSNERFLAQASGSVDLLAMQNTWTMNRDTKLGVRFVATHYYDIQSFLVRKSLNAKGIADLNGGSACVISGSTAEVNINDLFKTRGMSYTPVTFKSGQESQLAYGSGRCDFIMGDRINLANMRSRQENPADHTLLDEGIGREPLSISVRNGDDQWFSIVRWVYNGLLVAELHGITQANVDQMLQTATDSEATNLLGKTASLGEDLGLDNQFMVRALKASGNYGEMYERHVGPKSSLGVARGINALWTKGGLQYAPPFK